MVSPWRAPAAPSQRLGVAGGEPANPAATLVGVAVADDIGGMCLIVNGDGISSKTFELV